MSSILGNFFSKLRQVGDNFSVNNADASKWLQNITDYTAFSHSSSGFIYFVGTATIIGYNAYLDTAGTWRYEKNGAACRIYIDSAGSFYYETAASGSKDGVITWTNNFVLSSTLKLPGYDQVYLRKSVNQSITNITTTVLSWDIEDSDPKFWHDNVTNNSRITANYGPSKIQLFGQVEWSANTIGDRVLIIEKNGAGIFPGISDQKAVSGAGLNHRQQISTPVLDVNNGDYFELKAYQNSGSTLSILTANSYFTCKHIL